MTVLNNLHSLNDFISSNSEEKIYSFHLQNIFNNSSNLDLNVLLLVPPIKIVLVWYASAMDKGPTYDTAQHSQSGSKRGQWPINRLVE